MYDPSTGMPGSPGYINPYNPATDNLSNMVSQDLSGYNYNTAPLQQLQNNATSTSASPWAQIQSNLARTNAGQAASQATDQVAGSVAGADNNLAMTGGLSSGARERAAETGTQAGIGAQQGIQSGLNSTLSNIGLSDAANKQQEMMALPGMEAQSAQTQLMPAQMQAQAQAQDVAAQMAGTAGANAYNSNIYGQNAGIYGDAMTAAGNYAAANPNSPLPAYLQPGYNPYNMSSSQPTSLQTVYSNSPMSQMAGMPKVIG